MKFICDEMLGTLAKWLRILGYDTKYVKNIDDEKIIEIARREERILITRDKLLSRKADRSIYLENKNLEKQLKKVIEELNLKINKNKILTRCIICNEIVNKIEKEKIRGRVPEHVFNEHENFWICPKCHRIYWIGSHWNNMEEKLKKIKK